MVTAKLYYRVDRRRISLLKFIIEAYEGLAVVTTLDNDSGTVVLAVAPQCLETARELIADLSKWILIESCDSAIGPGYFSYEV